MVGEASADMFAIRVGSIILLPKEGTAESQEGDSPEKQAERANQVAAEVNRLIRESPLVKAEPSGELSTDLFIPFKVLGEGEERQAYMFGDCVVFRTHWPRKNQEMLFAEAYRGPVVEEFLVAFNGFVFAVAGACDAPLPQAYNYEFGREGRRILQTILGPSELWDIELIGPTPMRPMVYVCLADDPSAWTTEFPLVQEEPWTESLEVLQRAPGLEPLDQVGDVVRSLLPAAFAHFRSLVAEAQFITRQDVMDLLFQEARRAYAEIVSVPPWDARRWVARARAARTLKACVSECYGTYVDLTEDRRETARWVQRAEQQFGQHPLLAPHQEYCSKEVEDIFRWSGGHLLEGLRFYSEESRSQGLEVATVQAALLGAAIAGGIAVLVSVVT